MEEVTAGVYLVSISRSRYSAVYGGGHAKTALLHAAISAAAHQICEMLMNAQFRFCRDERSELSLAVHCRAVLRRKLQVSNATSPSDTGTVQRVPKNL